MPDKHYKQIVILSGKGGTGKTTVATALSEIAEAKGVIDTDVDANEKAYYFQQAQNGLYVRQAIVSKVLG